MKYLRTIIFCIVGLSAFGQELPQEIQQILDRKKAETSEALQNCRIHRIFNFPDLLREWFPLDLREEADKHNLNVGMIYDDNMRKRIVQLLRNEYREDELDTLVVRRLSRRVEEIRRQTFVIYGYDTLQVFKDNLLTHFEREKTQNTEEYKRRRKHPDAFKWDVLTLLGFDTTAIYKKIFDSLFQELRNEQIISIQNQWEFCIECIIKASGYIKDQRFVSPLEDIYKNSADNRIKRAAEEALVRMQINPYYENYVHKRTRTIESVQTQRPDFDLSDLVFIWRSQNSFKELSKYLLSDYPYVYYSSGGEEDEVTSVSFEAFLYIQNNIMNADLQEILKTKSAMDNSEAKKTLYDWMQENYGNYEIRRIW